MYFFLQSSGGSRMGFHFSPLSADNDAYKATDTSLEIIFNEWRINPFNTMTVAGSQISAWKFSTILTDYWDYWVLCHLKHSNICGHYDEEGPPPQSGSSLATSFVSFKSEAIAITFIKYPSISIWKPSFWHMCQNKCY